MYAIGDPAHIPLGHNDLVALIQEQADRFMVTVTLPDEATLGDPGHVDDHNLIIAALQEIADAEFPLAAATVSGTTGSPATTTPTVQGLAGTLYNFGSNGSITTTAGKALVCIIAAASADSGPNYGNTGGVLYGWIDLTAATHTVTVGATGTGGAAGGGSSIGSIASAPGGLPPTSTSQQGGAGRGFPGAASTDGYPVDITGASVAYGKEGSSTNYGSRTGATPYPGRVFIFIPD